MWQVTNYLLIDQSICDCFVVTCQFLLPLSKFCVPRIAIRSHFEKHYKETNHEADCFVVFPCVCVPVFWKRHKCRFYPYFWNYFRFVNVVVNYETFSSFKNLIQSDDTWAGPGVSPFLLGLMPSSFSAFRTLGLVFGGDKCCSRI